MKKFYTLLLASLVVSMSFAQTVNFDRINMLPSVNADLNVTENLKNEIPMIQAQAEVLNEVPALTSFADMPSVLRSLRSVNNDLAVGYERPNGTLYHGFTRDYMAYSIMLLYGPAMVPVNFVPYASEAAATFAWTMNNNPIPPSFGTMLSNGTFPLSLPVGGFFMPRVTATASGVNASYILGQNVSQQIFFTADVEKDVTEDGSVFHGQKEFTPLTLANINANRPASGNLYTGFQSGQGFTPQYSNADGPVRGVMQILPQLESPLYVESMTIMAINNGSGTTPVPAGGVLKLELFYLNEEGQLGAKIGESTTSTFYQVNSNGLGSFSFRFIVEHGGFEVNNPITIGTDSDVAIIVTGFDTTWNFAFMMGVATSGNVGSAYTLHGNDLKVHTFGYSNFPEIPMTDLYIQFNGIFNLLKPVEGFGGIDFPVAGGWGITMESYNDYLLYSAFTIDENDDIWIESRPNWIVGVDYDADYFESHGIIALFFAADALPQGVNGRSGEIVVASYGVSVTIPVTQGQVTNVTNPSVNNVTVVNTNNSFELTYTSDFTSVEVYNISGQRVASHNLPSNGSFSLPTNDLTRGTYLVRFTGNLVETVKVVK